MPIMKGSIMLRRHLMYLQPIIGNNTQSWKYIEQWRTQDFFGRGEGGSPGIFSVGGQQIQLRKEGRERGSGGGSPLVRGSTQFTNE
jgi:hypothetical protein